MTREEIINAAQEAGMIGKWEYSYKQFRLFNLNVDARRIEEALVKFAEFVAAEEREACAKICDALDSDPDHMHPNDCAEAIRARSTTSASACRS